MKEADDDDQNINWIGSGVSTVTVSPQYYDDSCTIIGDIIPQKGQESLERRIKRIEGLFGVTPRDLGLEDQYPDLGEVGDQMDQALTEITSEISKAISKVVGYYKTFADECKVMEKLKSENGKI